MVCVVQGKSTLNDQKMSTILREEIHAGSFLLNAV